MTEPTEAAHGSESEGSDGYSGSLPSRSASPLSIAQPSRSGVTSDAAEAAKSSEGEDSDDASGSLPSRPASPLANAASDRSADSSGESYEADDDSGSLPSRADDEDHSDGSGSLPSRPSRSPEGASADAHLATITLPDSQPIDRTVAPLGSPSTGHQPADDTLGSPSALNSQETRRHFPPAPPPTPNLLPQFLDALQAALKAGRLRSCDLQEAIRKFTSRHVREAHYGLASHDPQIMYNPSVRQIIQTPSTTSAPTFLMHEDALLSLYTQLILHPWSSSVAELELIGAAHAEATKHISFTHEIFEAHTSTKASLRIALDIIDDFLNSPPFVK